MTRTVPIIAALLFVALSAGAQPAFAQTANVVTIRSAELVQNSPQYREGQAQMRAEFERRKTDLEAEAKKLAEDLQKFRREADMMAPDARSATEKQLNERRIDFDYKQRQFNEDLQRRERELTEGMMTKIRDIIAQVAAERGAQVVIQDPVWAAPGTDITDDVLGRLSN